MSLLSELKNYLKCHARLLARAEFIQTRLSHKWIKVYATESLISDTWQLWNLTCKNILVKSCQGCVGRCGNIYPARPSLDNSFERIAYETKQFANNRNAKAGKISSFWEHPTWGDGKKINPAIVGLQPANANILTTAFGLPLFGHIYTQTLRNYLFHKDYEAFKILRGLPCFYGGRTPTHPAYYIWEYCSSSPTFYYYEWMSDMKHIIYQATM